MKLSQSNIIIFRVMLFIALLTVMYLATSQIEFQIDIRQSDKLGHALTFHTLALFADFSFPNSNFDLSKISRLLSFGLLIEIIQFNLLYRIFSIIDLAADGFSLLIYRFSLPVFKHVLIFERRWT